MTRIRLLIAAAVCSWTPYAAANDDWQAKALDAVRAEPQVVEAMFTGTSSFWASMPDNGSDRRGYAQFLCTTLMLQGMPVGDFYVIRVFDSAAMARNEMAEIGRFDCERTG